MIKRMEPPEYLREFLFVEPAFYGGVEPLEQFGVVNIRHVS